MTSIVRVDHLVHAAPDRDGRAVARQVRRVVFSWRLTDPLMVVADGLVPFAIDWADTPHPALTAAPGATLAGLRAEHPDAAHVKAMLRVLGIEMEVRPAPRPRLVATIDGQRGRVEIDQGSGLTDEGR